jgi:hypothetical protein
VRASPDVVAREDTVWIGTMFPIHGPAAAEFGTASAAAAELARREWTEAAGGLPRPSGDGKPRGLGIIECDDTDDARAEAAHLVEVGVPAVIGFHSSAEVLDLAATTFIPSRTFVVASINRSPMITRIPMPAGAPRLVWRTAGSIADNVAPASAVIEQLFEPKLRAAVLGKPLRVAIVRANDTTGRAAADAFVTGLDAGTSKAGAGRTFHDIPYDASTTSTTGIDYSATLRALQELRPHVVILVAALPGEGLIGRLEASWPATEPRPFYLVAGPLEEEALYRWIGTSAERRHRVFGLFPPRHTPANKRFVMHFNESFKPAVTEVDSPAGPYDAFYLLAYAAYASGEERPTGLGIAHAVAGLTAIGKKKVDVGPLELFDGLTALRGGAKIDLHGALSTMDFDPVTGDSGSDMAVLCIAVGDAGEARGELESGLLYRHATGALDGAMRCP